MVRVKDKLSAHWWWFDSQKKSSPNRSSWLQSTLTELDEKTEAMLKIIEQDADSFAQRAEMYYKKRPRLVNMVEDFYRTHRLLAEKYDQIKCESGNRLLTPWVSPLSFTKYPQEKLMRTSTSTEKSYDIYSETFDPDFELSDDMSEVEDPDLEEGEEVPRSEKETVEVSSDEVLELREEIERLKEESIVQQELLSSDEVLELREEIERLKEESRAQQELLLQKDEEKREAIRQLSIAMDLLREENDILRKNAAKVKASPKRENIVEFELKTFKEGFWKKLFSGST